MKAHIVQKDVNNRDLKPFLESAREAGTELLCFGELATSGCRYEASPVEPLDKWLELFRPYEFRIMVGLPLDRGARVTNTYLYYHKGECQFYDKINLFTPMNEDVIYRPGTTPGTFRTDFGKVGAAICYDIRFPELFDDLKATGASRLFIPAAFPRARIEDWRRLLVERAVQTGLPVVGINAVGDDGTNEFGGCSMVVDADGTIVAQADEMSETVLEVELG